MINETIRAEVLQRLVRIEAEHSVRILFAIESGSRAWGFASSNSDYDVRFIYSHDPSWYQAVDLEERRDVIEYAIVDDIDINGWDVRKALRLYWKSNPAFVEWIQSPITYLEKSEFRAGALSILPSIYAPEKGIYHYRSMAKRNYRGYLRKDVVPLKKYFYVLRPLLAARWVQNTGGAAPIAFEKLLALLEGEPKVLSEIHKLLALKRNTPELGRSEAVPILNEFIEAELGDEPRVVPKKSHSPEVIGQLNDLFDSVLREHGANKTDKFCPECGTSVPGGRAGCQQLFDEVLAREFGDYRYAREHRLMVDVYSLQHPAEYMRSAKSYAAHLTGMYAALERGDTADVNRAVQEWLNGPQTFQRPDNPGPRQRGVLTIAHVHEAAKPEEHIHRVREWAQSTWEAWHDYHHVARKWIEEATKRLYAD